MQQVSVITLGVAELARSRRFYTDGFGWTPVFENREIVFYQLNGVVLGTFLTASLAADMQRAEQQPHGAFALGHNLTEKAGVEPLMQKLLAAGGSLLRAADSPPHGGYRGYVADPDGHAWEIAWTPGFTIDAEGRVTFGVEAPAP